VTRWTLIAEDWQTQLAQIDTFERFELVARYNDVSTWELALPTDTEAGQILLNASRPRVVIWADNQVFRSGPVIRQERALDSTGDHLTLSGVDDLVWLRRRLAHPQPGTAAPPYNASAYDTQTGPASTVIAGYVNRNAGPLAVAARQVPGLNVTTPPAFGPNVTVAARYKSLLEFLQGIARAAGNVGFRIRDLVFDVFQPAGTAIFDTALGTLASWSSTLDAPSATYVYVVGQGEGTARTIREYADTTGALTAFGRIEAFQDRRDTNDPATMDQAGAEALAEAVTPPGIDLVALDTPSQRFLTDWNVGSLATVTIGDSTRTDVIVEVDLLLEGNRPPQVRPVLGASTVNLAVWKSMQSTSRRLRQLERV